MKSQTKKKPQDFTRLTLKLFRKKFYQKPVSLVKLSFLKKCCVKICVFLWLKEYFGFLNETTGKDKVEWG